MKTNCLNQLKKLQIVFNVDIETLENPTGYRIIDMDVLTDLFSVVCCPDCGANLKLLETKKQGILFHLSLVCKSEECKWTHSSWTSKKKAKASQSFIQ